MKATERRWAVGLVCLAMVAGLGAGCRKGEARKVTLVGSTSVQPFAEVLAEEYEKRNADAKVTVMGGGSGQGIESLAKGIADIGTCSRDLNDEEKALYTPHVIARDGLAVVVHPDNPVQGLTRQQAQDIFAGKIANWKDVGGADHAIAVVLREDGSGTREAFTHLIMAKVPCAKDAMVQGSNGAVKALVKGNPNAIGYMSLGQVKGELKALAMDGMTPSEAGVAKGEYKLWRPFLYVTKGPLKEEAQKFLDFTLSPVGQAMLEKEGLVGASSAAAAAASAPASAPANKDGVR
jgi:phosphate transport system substrate-binding protein